MAENIQTMLPEGQASATSSGWFGGLTGGLGEALKLWGEVEKVKAIKNAKGQGQQEQANVVEYDNGAAVLIDAPKKQPTQAQPQAANDPLVFGIPQSKLLMGSFALLGLALILKAVK